MDDAGTNEMIGKGCRNRTERGSKKRNGEMDENVQTGEKGKVVFALSNSGQHRKQKR